MTGTANPIHPGRKSAPQRAEAINGEKFGRISGATSTRRTRKKVPRIKRARAVTRTVRDGGENRFKVMKSFIVAG
jgi:hypothetical protein